MQKKKISQYKVIYISAALLIAALFSNAQKQEHEGYLLRCFTAKQISIEKLRNNFLFAAFLNEKDLFENQLTDSAHYLEYKEGRGFEIWFTSLFSNNIKLLDGQWDKRDVSDTACQPSRKIYLDDLSLYDLVYVYKVKSSEFYYIIMINKVLVEYCQLNKYSVFIEMFKERLGLKKKPIFLALSRAETSLLIKKLKNTTGIDGEVFIQ